MTPTGDDRTDVDLTAGPRSGGVMAALAWVLILIGDSLAIWRGYVAVTSYRQSLRDRLFDPPAAELAFQHARTAGTVALAGLLLAGVGMALLLRAGRGR